MIRSALAAAAVAGVAVALHGPSLSSTPAASAPAVRAPVAVAAEAAAAQAGPVPVRLQVPTAGVDARLSAIALDAAGALVPPADVTTAGWFARGPAPGDVGPAVIAGHVDSGARPGAFVDLRSVSVDDPVTVTRADGSMVRFVVTRVARFPKTAFPTAEVYGPAPDAELRLITCGGALDRAARSYLDDVVVFAREAG